MRIEKNNDLVNRLNRTKEERQIDFAAEEMARIQEEKRKRKEEMEKKKSEESRERKRLEQEAEIKSYGSVFKKIEMTSNKSNTPIDPKKFEEDFF